MTSNQIYRIEVGRTVAPHLSTARALARALTKALGDRVEPETLLANRRDEVVAR